MTIPSITPITEPTRLPNPRLWELVRREKHGVITAAERVELDRICASLEADQDNTPFNPPQGDSA